MKRKRRILLPVLGAILVALAGSWIAGRIADRNATGPRMSCVTRFGFACAASKENLAKAKGADFNELARLENKGVLFRLEQGRKAAILQRDGENCETFLDGGRVVWAPCLALDCDQ